jgi:prepilin-type N-terminal cleavage/methylation domain-containing protein
MGRMKQAFIHLGRPRDGRERTAPLRRAGGFTLIELLTVMAIIAILTALGVGLAGVASRKSKESATKAQLAKLTAAIESYHYDFHQYPPDNMDPRSKRVDPIINPLFYELSGTVASQQGRYYQLVDQDTRLSSAQVYGIFHRRGFLNSADAPKRPKAYLRDLKARQWAELPLGGVSNVALLVAPVEWPLKNASLQNNAPLRGRVNDARLWRYNPWQYNSSDPVHNPNSFDLWADVVIGKTRQIIGNWHQSGAE